MTVSTASRPAGLPAHLVAPVALVQGVEGELNAAIIGRAREVRATLVAVLSRQHIGLFGPRGNAKSYLLDRTLLHLDGCTRFKKQLMRTTTPDEILGTADIAGHTAGDPRRHTTHMAPEADFVYFDETDKGSSMILNAMLEMMNEHTFLNGITEVTVPLNSFFAAANALPQGGELAPFFDRITLRCLLGELAPAEKAQVVWMAAPAAPAHILGRDDLAALQEAVRTVVLPAAVQEAYTKLWMDLEQEGIVLSPRRLRWCTQLVQATALLEGRLEAEVEDLQILADALWEKPEDRSKLDAKLAQIANPALVAVTEKAVDVQSAYTAALATWRAAEAGGDEAAIDAAVGQLTTAAQRIGRTIRAARAIADASLASGRTLTRIQPLLDRMAAMHSELANITLGRI